MESSALQAILDLITKFGLPTVLCIYLLVVQQKKVDKLTVLIYQLTGVILVMSGKKSLKGGGEDIDG